MLQKFSIFTVSLLILITSSFLSPVYGELLQTYVNPNPTAFVEDRFGAAVDIDGDKIIIGSWEDANENFGGRAYLFDTSGNLLQTYINPSPADVGGGDEFGADVAIDGNNVVISARGDDDISLNSGIVYLFDTSGNLLQTLHKPGSPTSPGVGFGFSVAISGSNVVVGEPLADTLGFNTDSGQVFQFDTSGNLLRTIFSPTPQAGDFFGGDVAISGNKILVGASHSVGNGEALLYDTSGNFLRTYISPNPGAGSQFGGAVDIDGNNVLIGDFGDFSNSGDGKVFLFDTSGNLLQTYINPTPGPTPIDDNYGIAVAIDGTNVIIGASNEDIGVDAVGRAYHYDTSGNLLKTFDSPSPKFKGFFGDAVACSGNFALIGESQSGRTQPTSNPGFAYLFEKVPTPTNGVTVGGDLIPLDTTMVLVAGTQSVAAWMIPVIVSVIGIAIVIARKF